MNMKAKEYLSQLKDLKRQIQSETEYADELRETALSAGASYSAYGTRIHTQPSDKKAQLITLAIAYHDRADSHRIELMKLRDKIAEQIEAMTGMSRTVLFEMYVLDKPLSQVAEEQGYSYQRIKEWHLIALYEFTQKYPDYVDSDDSRPSVIRNSRKDNEE